MTRKQTILLVVIAALALPGFAYRLNLDPPCKCETSVYKRKKTILPCIVGVLRDSASLKPLVVGALVINGVVIRTNKEGKTYAEVAVPEGGKCKLVAKVFTYYFCNRTLRIHDGDSIVCVFDMLPSKEVLE